MTTILLVDSNNKALSLTAASLREHRPDWRILEASDGKTTLTELQRHSIDCLITEAALSDMSGFELLSVVQGNYPDTIRITLSDDPDSEVVLESARANHRFISKQVDSQNLISAIESSVRLQSMLGDKLLKARMRSIHSLPALPSIYQEMMNELASSNSSLTAIGLIIQRDAGLTATVLKIVNSAFYGLNQRVESVGQGVALLGVHLIKNITLTAKVFSQFEGNEVGLHRIKQLNDDACKVGAIANQFARHARISRGAIDHSQLAGMMCNIGELLATLKHESIADNYPDCSNQLMGAYLLRSWLMPDAIVEAVAMQNALQPEHNDGISPMTVLHAVRYLQNHFTQMQDSVQYENARAHLMQFVSESIAERWLEAFRDVISLTDESSGKQSRVA